MSDTWGDEWDEVADLVVVGSGAAGATAALCAAVAGAEVVVLEKCAFTGGTTARSGGVMWVPDNPVMRAAGIDDPRDASLRYLARTASPATYCPDDPHLGLTPLQYELLETVHDRGCEALDAIVAAGALTLEAVAYPDYYADLPEDAAPVGRVVQPALPPGWRRGVDPTGGQLLADSLLAAAERHGTRVLVEHEVVHLVRDETSHDRRALGVEVRTGRRTVLVGARRGVVFASGGFLHDPDLARAHLRGPVLGGAAAASATGDFVRIGIEAGAQLGNMAHAWWDQVAVEMAVRSRVTSRDVYSPFGDSMLMVNRHGVRVVNEKAPYNERGQVHHVWDPTRLEYPNLLLFMVFDDDVMQWPHPDRFRWPVPMPGGESSDLVVSAADLESLAEEVQLRLDRLAPHTGGVRLADDFVAHLTETIERFNRFAVAGRDDDFRRGESMIERTWAGPARGTNPLAAMHPLRPTGPYHCVIVGPGALDTKGGPVIDRAARVLGLDGHPITGLYAAGNCAASPAGQAYWGPGGTIGPAITFGYVAARTALGLDDGAQRDDSGPK